MPQPGWYPDPSDDSGETMRWWDGERWTADTRRRAVEETEPESSTKPLIVAAAVAAVLVALVGVVVLLGSRSVTDVATPVTLPAPSTTLEEPDTSTASPSPSSSLCDLVRAGTEGWAEVTPLEPIPEDPVGLPSRWEAVWEESTDNCAANLYRGEDPLLVAVFEVSDSTDAQTKVASLLAEEKAVASPGAEFEEITGGEVWVYPDVETSGATAWVAIDRYVVSLGAPEQEIRSLVDSLSNSL